MLNALHPDACLLLINRGLLCQDENLQKEIGRDVRYLSWTERMGTITRDHTFKIVGVQKDWKGEPCWRVLCNHGTDTFGRVAQPSEVEFV